MSDLLSKLKLGTSNIKLVPWPGTETQVAMHILSQQEQQEATFATERHFKNSKIEVNLVTAEEYESERALQILYRVLRDPANSDEPIAPTITDFRGAVTREEKKILIDSYLAFESECSPSPENLSSEKFDEVFTDLKKNCEATLSSITSIHTLRKLIITLVSQPTSSPMVNG